jgi:hypothetical protein
MKLYRLFLLIALIALPCLPSLSQSVIRTLAWELDTARPAVKEWTLVRGETVDLECRYIGGSSNLNVCGASVVLHCRTNGQAIGYSFQVTGSVGRASSTNYASVGWVTVRVRPDIDLPHDVTRVTFSLDATLNSARNLVSTGTLRLTGDPTGAMPAALAIYFYEPKGSAQVVSNALAASLQSLSQSVSSDLSSLSQSVQSVSSDLSITSQSVQSVSSVLSNTTQAVASAASQAESNRLALAALPPPSTDALRLINTNATRWTDGNLTVWQITNIYSRTELRITFSSDFLSSDGHRPPVSFYPWSNGFSADGWSGSSVLGGFRVEGDGNLWVGAWAQSPDPSYPETWVLYPGTVYPDGSPQGTGSATIGNVDIYDVITQSVDTVALMSDLSALTIPTNYVAGFAVPDTGSNCTLYVVSSNYFFEVYR